MAVVWKCEVCDAEMLVGWVDGAWLPGRLYCSDGCRRVVHAAANRAWRAANREHVQAYNDARRVPPTRLTCSECGGEFLGRPDRRTCSAECKRARKRRLDTRWPKRPGGGEA